MAVAVTVGNITDGLGSITVMVGSMAAGSRVVAVAGSGAPATDDEVGDSGAESAVQQTSHSTEKTSKGAIRDKFVIMVAISFAG